MEATLIIKDTLDVQVFSNLATTSKIASPCNCNVGDSILCYESICITGIICLTIFLVTISIVFLILWYKKKSAQLIREEEKRKDKENEALRESQRLKDIEKEKALYRERLANFIELQAKNMAKNKDEVYAFNNDVCKYYVAELKSYINGLVPTNKDYDFSEKDQKNNSSESSK